MGQTCYYPNGKEAASLQPCNATSPIANCCKDSDICLKNGLCFSPGLNSVVRRGCTDQTWNSTSCANVCLTTEFHSIDIVLTPCGEYGSFCCGQDKDARACCDSNSTEQVGTGEPNTSSPPPAASTPSGTNTIPTTTATACPDNGSLHANSNAWKPAPIAVTAVLGSALLAGMVFFWWKNREWETNTRMWQERVRDSDDRRRVGEDDIKALQNEIKTLQARPPSPPME
ncbi:hypothetical protein GJ744_010545 [Endocarpon pusillum]|uniref:Uncharacterized protein n=1 Tax=Endocarpon pusillum TaxID=364733 RepID=A0A8H7ARR5_9EURO|nr:hypothetical protein GJ744_010545 [Endocarpon pusillum]